MSKLGIRTKNVACIAIALSAMSSSVSHASACKVMYKEHKGSTKTVTLNANQSKTVNKKVDYVKNVGNYGLDVSFKVSGAALENFTMGTNPPHNRNPGSGNYAHNWAEHILVSFKCTNSTTFTKIAQGLMAAGNSPAVIAKLAKDSFGMSEKEIAKLLKQLGANAEKAANALYSAFQPSIGQLGTWLKYAGYAANQAAMALKKTGAKAQEVAYILKRYYQMKAEQTYQMLASLYNATDDQIVTWMRYAKYGVIETARALRTVANLEAKRAMELLIKVHKVSKDVALDALRKAGYAAIEVAELIDKSDRLVKPSPTGKVQFQQLTIKK